MPWIDALPLFLGVLVGSLATATGGFNEKKEIGDHFLWGAGLLAVGFACFNLFQLNWHLIPARPDPRIVLAAHFATEDLQHQGFTVLSVNIPSRHAVVLGGNCRVIVRIRLKPYNWEAYRYLADGHHTVRIDHVDCNAERAY
jgi:hypothetical protein